MILELLFPRKCILCRRLLNKDETDLCHGCRRNAPIFISAKNNIPFVAGWTAVWYYRDDVQRSIVRYKFRNSRSYAEAYARLLALRIQELPAAADYITWVPISSRRKLERGYDQVELLTNALSRELDLPAIPTLKKHRHNKAQSGIQEASQRKVNVLGAYEALPDAEIAGKTILLIDDVITTGATVSECAKTLLLAGAEKIYCAAIASAHKDK